MSTLIATTFFVDCYQHLRTSVKTHIKTDLFLVAINLLSTRITIEAIKSREMIKHP